MKNNYYFPNHLLHTLLCPVDGCSLENNIQEGNDRGVFEGKLKCRECNNVYYIKNGICELISPQAILADDFMTQEVKSRDKEAANYDKRLDKRYEKEIKPTLNYIGDISNKNIIEYGCGTGRFTKYLAKTSKYLLAIDFSRKSLEILQEKLNKEEIENVGLVLAEITKVKTKNSNFDLACAFQVIEHIPHKWQRSQWYRNVVSTLKDKKRFVTTVYYNDLRRRIKNMSTTGFHKDNIFYHYYSDYEIMSEFYTLFTNTKLRFLDIYLPLEVRFKLTKLFKPFTTCIAKSPIVNKLAHLVYVETLNNKNLQLGISFIYPSIFFKKIWFWFTKPVEFKRADIINFFSYDKIEIRGYKIKKGLTSVIDTKKPSDNLWQGMRKKFIRKQIDKGVDNGIVVKQDFNFFEFNKLYKNFRKNKNIVKDKVKSFPTNGILFSAYYKEKMLAAGLFIADGDNMRAWVLASKRLDRVDGKTREIVGQANRMVIWEAIQYAHDNGFKVFDLGGIDPDSKDANKRSLSEFKEAFGGERKDCYYYYKINSKFLKFIIKIKNKL